ncbi:MAG: PD-(D/E)XK nuclease family protein [Elusimicrobia bacterium]|nr:PD-(D/E)XK nuclease family protein [Elusimicrobiota bacterium]
MKLPRPLSHSSISLYGECPQKYKFKYVDKIPEKPRHFFSFGQSVHSALEFFYGVKTPEPPPLADLLKNYQEVWVAAGYRDEAQEAEYFAEGKRILAEFHRKHSRDFHVPYFVEYAYNFEVDGVPVTGRVDRVDKLPDGRLRVLDYKTGKKLATGRLESDAQLTMYQYACETLLGAEIGELVFYHLPTLKEHRTTRRGAPLVDALKARIVTTAESIEKELFEPKPDESVCRWCDYKPLCPVFKDQYAGRPAAPARASGEPELAALVDKYGAAVAAAEAAREEADRAGRELADALRKKGYVRAFGAGFEVSLSPSVRWEFLDKKKVLKLIKEAGAYEKVLAPSAPLVHKLIEDPATDAALRERLAEEGERVESPELKLRPL